MGANAMPSGVQVWAPTRAASEEWGVPLCRHTHLHRWERGHRAQGRAGPGDGQGAVLAPALANWPQASG